MFAGDDGGYAEFLPDGSGRLQKVRAGDGVHFEREGGDMIAREVLRVLNQRVRPDELAEEEHRLGGRLGANVRSGPAVRSGREASRARSMGGGSPGGLRPRPAPSPTCSSPAFTSVARPSSSWRACSHAAAPTSLRGTSRPRSPPARTRSSCPRTTVRASSTSFATRPRSSPSSTPHCSPSTALSRRHADPRPAAWAAGPSRGELGTCRVLARLDDLEPAAHENLEVRPRRGRDVRLVRSGGVVVGLGADDRRTGVPGEDCGFDFRLRVSGQRGLTRTAATGASTRAAARSS